MNRTINELAVLREQYISAAMTVDQGVIESWPNEIRREDEIRYEEKKKAWLDAITEDFPGIQL